MQQQQRKRIHPNRQPRNNNNNNNQNNQNNYKSSSTSFPSATNSQPPKSITVPSLSALHPGSPVSIILKKDQSTGHRVTGIIADILTRGNHPRGVKVRLRDGRVGRVQGVVSLEEGEAGEESVGERDAGLDSDGEREVGGGGGFGRRGGGARGGYDGQRGRGRGRGRREMEDREYMFSEESRQVDQGYFAKLEEADRRYEESRSNGGPLDAEVVKCPVCGEFEGDEAAVAYHVEGHFEE